MPERALTPEEREVDRLGLEWLLRSEGGDAERLAELLRQSPEVRERYAKACGLEVLLRAELGHPRPAFGPLVVSTGAAPRRPSTELSLGGCIGVTECFADDLPLKGGGERRRGARSWRGLADHAGRWWPVAVGLAASLALLLYPLWAPRLDGRGVDSAGLASHVGSGTQRSDGPPTATTNRALVVRDHESLRLVSRLTHTALLTSMAIPTTFAIETPATKTIGRGAVLLDNVAGQRERGYLLALPPQSRLEVAVDANSYDENTLAIVEIGPDGQASGDAVGYTNMDDAALVQHRRVGAIGTWSVQNTSSRPRHFLFTGSHKRFRETGDDSWYLSDYRVGFDSPGLLCVGWDDSGYQSHDESHRALLQRDYDDISATMRIVGLEASQDASPAGFHASDLLVDGPRIEDSHAGSEDLACRLVVSPRSYAVLRVTAQCWLPNAAALVDSSTRRLLWSDGAWADSAEYDRLVAGDRGVCVLGNPSDKPREYLLVAKNSTTEPGAGTAWAPSRFKVIRNSRDLLVVGFEDAIDHEDWDDVQFYIRHFRLE